MNPRQLLALSQVRSARISVDAAGSQLEAAIQVAIAAGVSLRAIATEAGVNVSTVSRRAQAPHTNQPQED